MRCSACIWTGLCNDVNSISSLKDHGADRMILTSLAHASKYVCMYLQQCPRYIMWTHRHRKSEKQINYSKLDQIYQCYKDIQWGFGFFLIFNNIKSTSTVDVGLGAGI